MGSSKLVATSCPVIPNTTDRSLNPGWGLFVFNILTEHFSERISLMIYNFKTKNLSFIANNLHADNSII